MTLSGILQHKQDHRKMGVSGIGKDIVTVGRDGMYRSIMNAVSYINTLNVLASTITATCSMQESNASGTLDKRILSADSGTPFSVFNTGQVVGVKIGTSTCPVLATVLSSSKLLFKNPVLTDFASVSCEIGVPNYKTVLILPGHVENVTAMNIPAFTAIAAKARGSTLLSINSGSAIFNMGADANETFFINLNLTSANDGATRICSWASHQYQADTYLQNLDGFSYAQDGFYFSDGMLGGVHVSGMNYSGGYDVFRLRAHREVNIFNSKIEAFSLVGSVYAQASALAIGSGSLQQAPVEIYNIVGNKFSGFGQDIIDGVVAHGDVRVIDLRNRINSQAFVNIASNYIYATGDDAGDVTGVRATAVSGGTETPTIVVKDNIFDVRNDGAGGNISMHSTLANYEIKRANNVQLSGCVLGSNTAALTTV